jgi:hypothetical protein
MLTSWMGWRRTLTMSFEQFARNFAGDVPSGELWRAYQRYIVPTPGRLLFQDAAHIGDRVDWGNRHRAPLLLIAGEKDRTVEASMVRAAYKAYSRRSTALTEFKEFSQPVAFPDQLAGMGAGRRLRDQLGEPVRCSDQETTAGTGEFR